MSEPRVTAAAGAYVPAAPPAVIQADHFELNERRRVQVRHVGRGRHRVVIVDDFYAHPERVATLANDLRYSTEREIALNYPGERAEHAADTRALFRVLRRYFPGVAKLDESLGAPVFSVSRFHGDRELSASQRQPHIDPIVVALVYLNPPRDCSGGTALYRHRSTGLERIPLRPTAQMLELAARFGYRLPEVKELGYPEVVARLLFNERLAPPPGECVGEGNRHWQLMTRVEMRFNRLLIFAGNIPHRMWTEPGTFVNGPRLCQLLGMPFAESVPP